MQRSIDESHCRRTTRDLVALSAFPSIWVGYHPLEIAESMADVLLNTLPLDFVYVRLCRDASGDEPEVFRASRPEFADKAREIGWALAPLLDNADTSLLQTIPNPVGSGIVQLLHAHLGRDGGEGVVIAGSRQADFPSEDDRLLLSVGASQAGMVLVRLRAERGLRESEERFRQLAENIEGYFWLNSPQGNQMFYISPGYEKICGRTCESVYRRPESWSEIIHPDDRERVLAIVQEPLRDQERQIEYRIVRPDGTVRWIRDRAFPVRDASGEVCRVAGIGEDITEWKRAQQDLRRQNEILQTIFEHIPVMINFVDSTGTIQLVNRHWESVLGWTWDEARNLDMVAETYPDPVRREQVAEYVRQPAPGWTDFKTRVRDGRTIDTSWSLIVLSDGTRIGFGQDISERRRAEDEMRNLNAALENAVEGIARLDNEGNYLTVNRAYADMLGYRPEDLIARSWPRTVHPEDIQKVEAAYQRMLCEESVELEVRALRKDSSVFWKHLMMVKAVDQEGRWIGHYCFMKDISERKQAEDSLRQSALRLQILSRQVLEAQEQERRHLARELHDEIGQILSTISVNLHTNMELCSCPSRTRLEDSIRIVDHAIDQVRNLSLNLRPSMLDVLGLVATLRWHAARQSETGNFTVSFFVESSGARLPADLETACYRVVQEALTNVVRHAHARQVWIEYRQQESDVQLVVRDDGVGFNREAVRLGGTRGVSFGVLGMEERVALLGGQMEITSTPGQGTTIRVVLPLDSQAILPDESVARR